MAYTKKLLDSRLNEHLNEVLSKELVGDWFFIATNGSINYNLDTDKSDVDSKMVCIPSLNDLIFNNGVKSSTHFMSDNEEHVEIKDINSMFNILLKQSLNFVETLYAKSFVVNEKYRSYFNELLSYRDRISRYNEIAAINCATGTMRQKRKDILEKESCGENFDKSYYNLVRYAKFIARYADADSSYKDCICFEGSTRDSTLKIKTGAYNKKSALASIDGILESTEPYVEAVICRKKPLDKDLLLKLDDLTVRLIKASNGIS